MNPVSMKEGVLVLELCYYSSYYKFFKEPLYSISAKLLF